jgi:MFS family permease
MEKTTPINVAHEETSVGNEAEPNPANKVEARLAVDDSLEHELTVKYMLAHHNKLIAWTFFWALCAIGWGFDAQVNGAMISVPSFRRDFGYVFEGEYVLPADWQSAFNVMGTPGQFFGGFLCSWIADRWGRKAALIGGLVSCTGGIVGQMVSTSRVGFLISKLVLGFGLGFYLTIGPMVSPLCARPAASNGL